MEAYELDPDKIVKWAIDYASYEELEQTAKTLYQLFASRRKEERPEELAKAKEYRRKLNGGRNGRR